MYYVCCVCKNLRRDAILHHFPCTKLRLNKWLECLNRDDLNKLLPEQLSKLFVCHKHFEKKFLTPKSRLLGKAYPSLFTEDEIMSGIPSQENVENIITQTEHSYSRKIHFDHTYCQLEPLKESNAASSSEFQNSSQRSEIIATCSSEFQNLPGPTQNPPLCHRTGLVRVRSLIERKPSRKWSIENLKDLTPTCQIIKEYKKSDFYRRAKRAQKFSKEKSFEKLTENMNPYAKKILKMQINLRTKKKKG